jgi:hypothetical protein
MKKIKLFYTITLLTVIFFSCSESENPASLVGKWEATTYREYVNNKLVDTDNFTGDDIFLIFKKDGTFTLEIEGDIECEGSYGSKMMDSKSQKIDWCDGLEGLVTVKSNDLIVLSIEDEDGDREEVDFKRF